MLAVSPPLKTRFYAGDLVAQGPSGDCGVGWMRRRGWVPGGLPDRSPDAAQNHSGSGGWRDLRRPLKFPNLIVSLTRFGHVLEGYVGPPFSICARPRRLVTVIETFKSS